MALAGSKSFWVICILVVILGAFVFWAITSAKPLRLVILYDDIGELKKGDPVVWKTFTIGKIESIEPLVDNQIGVTISIKEDYADRITHDTTFTLQSEQLLGLIGQNAIEIELPPVAGRPYEQGEKVQGVRIPETSLVEEGKQWTLDQWRRLKDQVSLILEESKSSPYRAELEEALDRAKSLAEQGIRQVKEGAEKFRKEHQKDFEDALKNLERIRDEMARKGDQAAAKALTEQIEKLRAYLKH